MCLMTLTAPSWRSLRSLMLAAASCPVVELSDEKGVGEPLKADFEQIWR